MEAKSRTAPGSGCTERTRRSRRTDFRQPGRDEVCELAVPVFCIERQGNVLEWLDETHFLERPWNSARRPGFAKIPVS
jgi:hypothetical protein